MQRFAALFKGVNVGGNNLVRMAELRAHFEACGYGDVASHVQSGNVVFSGDGKPDALAAKIGDGFAAKFGFEPTLIVVSQEEIDAAIAGNPFPDAVDDPAKLHCGFLFGMPGDAALEAIRALDVNDERWAVSGRCFYLHTPSGLGQSKFADKAVRALNVPVTMRNWRTLLAIRDLM